MAQTHSDFKIFLKTVIWNFKEVYFQENLFKKLLSNISLLHDNIVNIYEIQGSIY